MSKKSREEYLESIKNRYKNSCKADRTKILDEFCTNCGYNRKYAIRILNNKRTKQSSKQLGAPVKYDTENIRDFLITTWKAANLPCSKRLKYIIQLWLPMYVSTIKKLSSKEIQLLKQISPSTIDRLFKPIRHRYKKRGLCTTKPGSVIKEMVPIKTGQWEENRVGYFEADTVAHCGQTVAGMFAYTLNMVDISTGWSIQRAVWGKGETGVIESIKVIEAILPFKIKGFDSDNGSEFLNWNLLKYFKHRDHPINYTRSRAYHKNDNAHVEGKNWTLIRQYLGYERFDKVEIVGLMNELYSSEWYYLVNFFLPSVKLITKQRVGSKIVKRHDKPKTPLERLLMSEDVSKEMKSELKSLYKKLNPYELEKQIKIKIGRIFSVLSKQKSD